MPRITKTLNQPSSAQFLSGTSTSVPSSGGAEGRALQQLGNTITSISEDLGRKSAHATDVNYLANTSVSVNEQLIGLEERTNETLINSPGTYSDTFMKGANDIFRSAIENAPSDAVRNQLTQNLATKTNSIRMKTLNRQQAAVANKFLTEAQISTSLLESTVLTQPSKYGEALENLNGLIEASKTYLSPEDSVKFGLVANKSLAANFLKGTAFKDPASFNDFLTSGTFDDILTMEEQTSIRDNVTTFTDKRQRIMERDFEIRSKKIKEDMLLEIIISDPADANDRVTESKVISQFNQGLINSKDAAFLVRELRGGTNRMDDPKVLHTLYSKLIDGELTPQDVFDSAPNLTNTTIKSLIREMTEGLVSTPQFKQANKRIDAGFEKGPLGVLTKPVQAAVSVQLKEQLLNRVRAGEDPTNVSKELIKQIPILLSEAKVERSKNKLIGSMYDKVTKAGTQPATPESILEAKKAILKTLSTARKTPGTGANKAEEIARKQSEAILELEKLLNLRTND